MSRHARLVAAVVLAMGGLWVAGCGDSTDKLKSDDSATCVQGLRELAKSSRDEAVQKVAETVGHRDEVVAAEAVRALGQIRRPRAAEALKQVASAERRGVVRQEAVIQLGRRPDANSLEVLRQVVETDPDPRVRAAAATSLARLGSLTDVPLLVKVAENDDDLVVQSRAVGAVESLSGLKFGYDSKAPVDERKRALERMRGVAATAAAVLIEERKKQGRG